MPESLINSDNGWNRWENHVLAEQARMSRMVEELQRDLNSWRLELSETMGQTKGRDKVVIGLISAGVSLVVGIASRFVAAHF